MNFFHGMTAISSKRPFDISTLVKPKLGVANAYPAAIALPRIEAQVNFRNTLVLHSPICNFRTYAPLAGVSPGRPPRRQCVPRPWTAPRRRPTVHSPLRPTDWRVLGWYAGGLRPAAAQPPAGVGEAETATTTVLPHFGALLRRHRLAAGLTQEALAERAGLSARAVSDLERDGARLPRLDSLAQLGDALTLTAAERSALRAAARPVADAPTSSQQRRTDVGGETACTAPRSAPAAPAAH